MWPRQWNGLWSSSLMENPPLLMAISWLGAEYNCPPDSGEFLSSAAGSAMPPIFMKDSLECLWCGRCCWWVPIGNLVLFPNSVAMRFSHTPLELQRRRKQLQNLPLLKLTHTTADDPVAEMCRDPCICTHAAASAKLANSHHMSRPGQLSPGHHFRGWWHMYKTGAVEASEGYKAQQQQPKQIICWIIRPVSRAAWLLPPWIALIVWAEISHFTCLSWVWFL